MPEPAQWAVLGGVVSSRIKETSTIMVNHDDQPLTRVFVTMLQQLGIETDSFAGATGSFSELLS